MSRDATESWLAPHRQLLGPGGTRVLDLGCGAGADAAFLCDAGFVVTGCDRAATALRDARIAAPAADFIHVDISRPLPFSSAAFGAVVASLSLHYLPWVQTLAAAAEVKRVLAPHGVFIFRVNASDDLNFGAGRGQEVEPGLFLVEADSARSSPLKRFFDAEMVHAMLAGLFAIERLEHVGIDRGGRKKRTWECVARPG